MARRKKATTKLCATDRDWETLPPIAKAAV